MARLQTEIASLHISDTDQQARLSRLGVRAIEPGASSPQAVAKGSLYILMELGGEQPASARLYRLLINTIQGVYYDAAGGITGGITEAILAAHQALRQQNAIHPKEAQLGGVSCVVLRGEELYIGIGGPAMTLVGYPNRIEQFPTEINERIAPLGGNEAPTVELLRRTIEGPTLIIQLQSEWVARIPNAKLIPAAAASELAAAQEYLEALAPPTASLSALLLRISGPSAGDLAEEDSAAEDELLVEAAEIEEPSQAEPSAGVAPRPEGAGAAAKSLPAAQEPAKAERPKRRWPWLLLLLLPLVVVMAIAGVSWQQQRVMAQEFQILYQGAEAALQAATAEGVPEDIARKQLADAEERLQAALDLKPADPQALELQEIVQATLDQVNQITPLYKLITLKPMGGQGSDPGRVIVQGDRLYTLDRGLDQVDRFNLSEISGLIPEVGEEVVAQHGQLLSDGQLVGELLDMNWIPAGGLRRSSNLFILDSNRNVLEVGSVLGLRALPVADQEQWQSPRLIAGYNGNLYLLDSESGRILRYRPSEDDGYSNPPENYLANDTAIDLSRVVDMAIDGNIWLLYSDGTVQTFFQGRQQPFVLQPPPNGPITEPQALHVGSEAGAAQTLYIADSSMGRILEYDKEGNYLRQFRPVDKADRDKLRQMRAFHVDEIERIFYILTAEGLFRTDIP